MSVLSQPTTRQQAAARIGPGPRVVPLRQADFLSADQPLRAADPSYAATPASAAMPAAWAARQETLAPAPLDSSRPSQARSRSPEGLFSNLHAVLVGLSLLLGDLVPELFRPIAFFSRHARTLVQAAGYLSIPLAATVAIYLLVPGMVVAFPLNAARGWVYLGALFLASGISACLFLAGLRGIGAGFLAVIAAAKRRARA